MLGRAYYNDTDSYAAAWLRNLAAGGLIPAGDDQQTAAEAMVQN